MKNSWFDGQQNDGNLIDKKGHSSIYMYVIGISFDFLIYVYWDTYI